MPDLRDSLDLIRMVRPEAGTTALEHEILAEQASALGAAEARIKKAIARLDPAGDGTAALEDARQAVWAYFVQRELLGFLSHTEVIQDLGIPPEVLAGLGAFPGKQR